jgi:hypothetical protein
MRSCDKVQIPELGRSHQRVPTVKPYAHTAHTVNVRTRKAHKRDKIEKTSSASGYNLCTKYSDDTTSDIACGGQRKMPTKEARNVAHNRRGC